MDDDLLFDPGTASGGDGELPQDQGGDIENLQASFPTLSVPDNFVTPTPLHPSPMDTSSDADDSSLTGLPTSTGSANTLDASGFFNNLQSLADSAFGAFVTNPQNAATAEGVADNNAALSLTSSSQLFSYLLLAIGIFVVVSLLSKK